MTLRLVNSRSAFAEGPNMVIASLVKKNQPSRESADMHKPLLSAHPTTSSSNDTISKSGDRESRRHLDKINRRDLVYLALRSQTHHDDYIGALNKGLKECPGSKRLSSCLDGTEPYAELYSWIRPVYLAAQADRDGKGIDLHFHEENQSSRPLALLDLVGLDHQAESILRSVASSLRLSVQGDEWRALRSLIALKYVSAELQEIRRLRPHLDHCIEIFKE